MMTQQAQEVADGRRFEFGQNWRRFLEDLTEERIGRAQESLQAMLGLKSLAGQRFLDIGSGSGLFSLAAKRLGASVRSFDYDPHSAACTAELKRRYFRDDDTWIVEEGSILDTAYVQSLGTYDIVYSWGVLHHTGAMWQALDNASRLVADQGTLFIAIYNDQGGASRRWLMVKRVYNRSPQWGKILVAWLACIRQWTLTVIRDTFLGNPLRTWFSYKEQRGMSPWRDVIDWVGGYPFEVAKPEEIFDFYRKKGFDLQRMKTCAGGIGCNEFVFHRVSTERL
ncbi:MAG: class I SAM-dependent methyltransferase [Nitrospira sp.]|nr:class I SAM-dependent methyltransferase [Nitrospira sp.]